MDVLHIIALIYFIMIILTLVLMLLIVNQEKKLYKPKTNRNNE